MRRFPLGTALVALCISGCAIHAQPLAELQLRSPHPVDAWLRTDKRILVMPFTDQRGDVFSTTTPLSHVPVANWFHQGSAAFYPEHTGRLRLKDERGERATVGTIGTAMPGLLVDTLRKSRVTTCAVAGNEDPNIIASDFDYVVTGRVFATRLQEDSSGILQIAFGLFGVPYRFARYDLAYEISLFDSRDPSRPVFQHVYRATERVAQGLYYNHGYAYPMFVRGLERTLPEVARDLATLMAGRG
jgi:hypothetical protein